MQLRLNLKHHFLQKYDNLDCENRNSTKYLPKLNLIQINRASSKKQEISFYHVLSLEWLSTQKSHQVDKTKLIPIRKNNYFLLLDYFTSNAFLFSPKRSLIKIQNYPTLKNYLVSPENPISFSSIMIEN